MFASQIPVSIKRSGFGATLKELAGTDDRIMILDADLGGASFFLRFKESRPVLLSYFVSA